jgi:LysR family transcriptional regulator, nod-box dependent transcriptional activator
MAQVFAEIARSHAVLLRQHNLNFIPVLRELLRTQSVGETAEAVGLSPSGVSAALARLRETFDDELLVPVGRKLQLTQKGRSLIEQTERVCADMELLLRPSRFEPRTAENTFVVATADYVSFLLAPRMAGLLAAEAPKVCVRFMDIPSDYRDALGRGDLDFVVVSRGPAQDLVPWTASTPFLNDDMVVIASRRQRGFASTLTRAAYESSPHVAFQLSRGRVSDHEALALNALGIRQKNRIIVQQFLALPAIVQDTHCLALVQRRLADAFRESYEIDVFPPPFNMPPLELTAHWRRVTDSDPASVWFRDLMRRALPD